MSQYAHPTIDLGELSRRKLRNADNLRRAVLIHNVMRSSLTMQLVEEPTIQYIPAESESIDMDIDNFDHTPSPEDKSKDEHDWLDSILDDLDPMDTDPSPSPNTYSPPSSPPELDIHFIDSDSSDDEDEDEDVTTPLGPDFVGDTYFFSDLPYHSNRTNKH